eukprot:m51a1_g6386 hypothetical protein (470) ;mRNA; r:194021-195661
MSVADAFECGPAQAEKKDYVLSISTSGIESTAAAAAAPAPPRAIPRELQTAVPTHAHDDGAAQGPALPAAAPARDLGDGLLAEMQRAKVECEGDERTKFRYDMECRPEAPGAQAYEATPIDGFGSAILRGLGWSEGAPIGKNSKAPVAVIEVKKRLGNRLGLGADPQTVEMQKRIKALARKGIEITANGPEAVGKQAAEQAEAHVDVPPRGALVSVADGPEEGSVGVVNDSEAGQVLLRLYNENPRVLGAREVWVGAGDLSVMDGNGLDADNPVRKFWKALLRDSAFMKAPTFADRRREAEERQKRESKPGATEAVKREPPSGEACGAPQQKRPRLALESQRRRMWAESNLVVRVVSKKVHGGRYYRLKARVIDVVSDSACDIEMLDGSKLVQDVPVSALETVIPPLGQRVLVLGGEHRGLTAKLLDKRVLEGGDPDDDPVAVVQVDSDLQIVQLPLDDVCLYAGEPRT